LDAALLKKDGRLEKRPEAVEEDDDDAERALACAVLVEWGRWAEVENVGWPWSVMASVSWGEGVPVPPRQRWTERWAVYRRSATGSIHGGDGIDEVMEKKGDGGREREGEGNTLHPSSSANSAALDALFR
jgi:hypothetical protein